MTNTEKRLKLFNEEELIVEVMEGYISVIEYTYVGFLDNKVSRRRECFDKLKLFLAKSIAQAIAEEREMVVGEIEKPLEIVADFVERWNKQDEDKEVAQAVEKLLSIKEKMYETKNI